MTHSVAWGLKQSSESNRSLLRGGLYTRINFQAAECLQRASDEVPLLTLSFSAPYPPGTFTSVPSLQHA